MQWRHRQARLIVLAGFFDDSLLSSFVSEEIQKSWPNPEGQTGTRTLTRALGPFELLLASVLAVRSGECYYFKYTNPQISFSPTYPRFLRLRVFLYTHQILDKPRCFLHIGLLCSPSFTHSNSNSEWQGFLYRRNLLSPSVRANERDHNGALNLVYF